MSKTIKIGGASGYWGESLLATPQLLKADLDYLVYDYLAEITMAILARARARDASQGYAADFVSGVVAPCAREAASKNVKLLANAGGVNPRACAEAIRMVLAEQGLDLKVAVVSGDDLLAQREKFAAVKEMFSGADFPPPEAMTSINAYLGAFPVAQALSEGADIVVTGRTVDSALTLGACIHEFGWGERDWDLLAAGSLAGHLLECGPQATGGNYTDWHRVADTLAQIGYPIAEMHEDGTFVCTKPDGTGGEVSRGTLAEQLLYEIGDPQAYLLPDVACDFSAVEMEELAPDKLRVSGAKGRAAPATLKVCATYADGFRGGSYFTFCGSRAGEAARAFADAALARARDSLRQDNMPDYDEVSVEVLGSGSHFGGEVADSSANEVVLKLAARHESDKAIALLFREAAGMGLATPVGLSGFAGTRPRPSPVVRLFSFVMDKSKVPIEVRVGDKVFPMVMPSSPSFDADMVERVAFPETPATKAASTEKVEVPLERLAWGRSGDKGNKANIGIIARRPEYLPYLWAALSEERVASVFAHFLNGGRVERFYLPGMHALNFVLHDVLGGGGTASLRNDAQGKTYAQILLAESVSVPRDVIRDLIQD